MSEGEYWALFPVKPPDFIAIAGEEHAGGLPASTASTTVASGTAVASAVATAIEIKIDALSAEIKDVSAEIKDVSAKIDTVSVEIKEAKSEEDRQRLLHKEKDLLADKQSLRDRQALLGLRLKGLIDQQSNLHSQLQQGKSVARKCTRSISRE